MGQRLGIQLSLLGLGCEYGLQHQRHVLQQGIRGLLPLSCTTGLITRAWLRG